MSGSAALQRLRQLIAAARRGYRLTRQHGASRHSAAFGLWSYRWWRTASDQRRKAPHA